jgi:adenylosuccinate lyase
MIVSKRMCAWRGEGQFRAFLEADPEVSKALSKEKIAELFDERQHTRHVDTIFKRVFG